MLSPGLTSAKASVSAGLRFSSRCLSSSGRALSAPAALMLAGTDAAEAALENAGDATSDAARIMRIRIMADLQYLQGRDTSLHTKFSIAYHARMTLSVFDIFKIGIGPSSSHTMGPMNAARSFAELLDAKGLLSRTSQVSAQLYGSLALTGRGHCTDRAILLGLEGMSPDTIDSRLVDPTLQRIRQEKRLRLLNKHEIEFDEPLNLLFHTDQVLPGHSNGMRFTAHDAAQQVLAREEYYSVGGGFIIRAGAEMNAGAARRPPPYEFASGEQLLEFAKAQGLEIHELILA